jgi:hypothetical protein
LAAKNTAEEYIAEVLRRIQTVNSRSKKWIPVLVDAIISKKIPYAVHVTVTLTSFQQKQILWLTDHKSLALSVRLLC